MYDLYLPFFNVYLPLFIIWIISIILGLSIGSFLTCVLYRVPRGLSLWGTRRSFCPKCGHTLTITELIPLVSYLLQRGRCRACHAPIGWRYAAIEAISLAMALIVTFLMINMLRV
jgi:leader peptidase (prepilin peptidase)/N-methyltransferase